MKEIIFTKNAIKNIEVYIDLYTSYFTEFYSNTGIWSEEIIIEMYSKEGEKRFFEIVDAITQTLQRTIISYPNNIAKIRWKSKILTIKFTDDGNSRIIENIKIG